MSKLLLVTGGAGFIGSHLVEALIAKGYRVRVLDSLVSGRQEWVHPEAEFIQGDVTDLAACQRAVSGTSGIFHMAAMSRVIPGIEYVDRCSQSNIIGTQNILMAAQQNGCPKIIYSGSSTYYGNQPVPQREYETAHEPLNAYGLTKAVGEKLCLLFDAMYNVPTVVLRYFNVYGPRQPQTGAYALVLGIFLKRWNAGEQLIIHGDGSQRRDFVHVLDVVRANIMAFESSVRGKTYNVGCGVNVSIKELANMITDNQVHADRRSGDSMATLADISRIKSELGWQPEISFADGVADMKRRVKEGLELGV